MDVALAAGVAIALAFAFANGLNDAANAVAMPVVTRVARPGPAVLVAAAGNLLGPLVLGTAVADTIAGIVTVSGAEGVAVVSAGLTGAVGWLAIAAVTGMPSSAGHALVGGLTGAALVAGGGSAVNWGGLDGWRPVGVLGALLALALSVVLGLVVGAGVNVVARRLARRATTAVTPIVAAGEWLSAGALAFGHGANDAQKSMGAIAAILLAAGRQDSLAVPTWVVLVCAVAITVGTAFGGWSIVRTVGRRIYRVRPIDGLVAQSSSTAVVLASSFVGAPVSTTQVLASSVVGVGVGRRRLRHISWRIVGEMGLSWIVTLPVAGVLGALTVPLWRLLT